MERRSSNRILTICLGLLTAAAVVLSQAFYFQASDFKKEKAKTEQAEQTTSQSADDDAAFFISVPDSSIPSSFSIEVSQELTFVLEILFNTEDERDVFHAPAISAGQLFHTLFSVLISPNAP